MRSTVSDDSWRSAAPKKTDANPYAVALRLLAGRDYTAAAITKKLLTRGCDEARVIESVDRLTREGFLNDRRYAERLVESCRTSGRYVGYRLRQELRRRGIAGDLTVVLLAEQQEPQEELSVARGLVARRYAGFNPICASDQERRRIAGFLQRRGFGADTIWKVLERSVSTD